MPAEVQRIPPAPRRVSWKKVLGYRWPLLALTFALAIYGGVLTWLFYLANSGAFVDAERFEQGARNKVEAVVRATRQENDASQRVDYEFYADGQNWTGTSRVPGGDYREGQAVPVEYRLGMPTLNRIAGAPPDLRAPQLDPNHTFLVLVVPGLLIGLCWLAGMLHLRHVLVHGIVSVGQVLEIRRVRFCLPECLSVRFSFKDHRAVMRHSRHWVRMHSPLGQRLMLMVAYEKLERVPVLHDRRMPQHCRLVEPADFSTDLGRIATPSQIEF